MAVSKAKGNKRPNIDEIFKAYISTRQVLVVDTNTSSRNGLKQMFVTVGAKVGNLLEAKTYADAEKVILEKKPHVVVCDFKLDGNKCALDLLQKQRHERPQETKECLFILVTGDTSQSTVAQAAEEDVDAFILKPYTVEVVKNTVIKVALAKLNPSEYLKKIDEGKIFLFDTKLEEAMKVFEEAMTMNPRPTLACFYHGQAQLMKQMIDDAKGSFEKGLNFNKIHFKCLIGLFDVLMDQKMFKEAYEIVKKVARYFPANPQRLATVLRLAIMTQNYDDIEKYYQTFTNIDERNDDLIKYICAALVVTGKFYLRKKFSSRAFELFQKAAITAAGREHVIKEIVVTLVEESLPKEAEKYMGRFRTRASEDYMIADFAIANASLPALPVIQKGNELIKNNIEEPLIYKALIRRNLEMKNPEEAKKLLDAATSKWAAQKDKFQSIFQEAQTEFQKSA